MNEEEQKTYERLLEKASESFVLAIEIYNRPSIKYRVEGFSFFVCNAWELMLKAKLIQDQGLSSIYYKDNPDRTITLELCVARVFTNAKDPLRRNLEGIIKLRNTSTHFIVEEYEQIYVGLFQSCVTNFDDKMFEFHGRRMGDVIPPHFLTLSMTADPATPEKIRAKYSPDVAEKFLFDEAEIEQEIAIQANQRYYSVMVTELAVVKNPKNADFTVAYDADSDKAIRTAKVFQDPSRTHPFSAGKIVDQVNNHLKKKGIVLKHKGEPKTFTTADRDLFIKFYDMKNKPEFSYRHEIGQSAHSHQYTYSTKAIDFIVQTISEKPDGIIEELKKALQKGAKSTPGAKDSKP